MELPNVKDYANQAFEFIPDWHHHMTKEEIEQDLEVKFTGPGWYVKKNDVCLILPTPQKVGEPQRYRVCVYNSRNPAAAFNQIVNLPTRLDDR